MERLRRFCRIPSACLALFVAVLSLPMSAHGAMIDTSDLIEAEQMALNRAQLTAALEQADVQQQLIALGVDVEQAKERVAALSREEIAALNGKLSQLPAGGDALGLIVFVFLVLLFTDILGYTDIFPFVKKR